MAVWEDVHHQFVAKLKAIYFFYEWHDRTDQIKFVSRIFHNGRTAHNPKYEPCGSRVRKISI